MSGTNAQQNSVNPKHSAPFYISPQLFQNKRLKRRLLKRKEYLAKLASETEKTERRKTTFNNLKPDVTIDLLSDEENTPVEQPLKHVQNLLQHPSGSIQLCNTPNITLIPVQNLQKQQQVLTLKRKRKAQKPKRLSQPTIVNESIVLTDDSDVEIPTVVKHERLIHSSSNIENMPNCLKPTPEPDVSITAVVPQQATLNPQAAQLRQAPQVAQVDEEVTVSIVPRSSTAGHCTKAAVNEIFPMLPDETTVHTVIANRIYELSLTKLREGLASCGLPEFTNGQQTTPNIRRKNIANVPPATLQPAPVSLKLSSDLSISLISDEEESQQEAQITPEKLLEQQPHLSVQQIQLPLANSTDGRNVPKRRKLR
ncbi:protein a6 [Teleopsis dalmanni]|uniref:protein a6 n=1 Tax=Teleopsis dalmanni TaxID=139649 RepID=UPI0018CEF43B|nr:protein a6 [Teleopsis dalmanni]XP_037934891.1 protein a6 [Teleopsis dalmanni]XP_037934892.1 protein a6 [Teleopsis dalmanni]